MHGNVAESFWIWVEDPDDNYMYHHEYFLLSKKHVSVWILCERSIERHGCSNSI